MSFEIKNWQKHMLFVSLFTSQNAPFYQNNAILTKPNLYAHVHVFYNNSFVYEQLPGPQLPTGQRRVRSRPPYTIAAVEPPTWQDEVGSSNPPPNIDLASLANPPSGQLSTRRSRRYQTVEQSTPRLIEMRSATNKKLGRDTPKRDMLCQTR